jgi:hypothetical protein
MHLLRPLMAYWFRQIQSEYWTFLFQDLGVWISPGGSEGPDDSRMIGTAFYGNELFRFVSPEGCVPCVCSRFRFRVVQTKARG